MVALAEALKVNKTLTHVYIKQNDMGNTGAKALLDVLKENDTLKKIDMSLDDIDEEHVFFDVCQGFKMAIKNTISKGHNVIKEKLVCFAKWTGYDQF